MPTFRTITADTLQAAHAQWASRPDDERFLTLADLSKAVHARKDISREPVMTLGQLSSTLHADNNGGIYANGQNGKATFTHHAFGQLATLAEAPASYLRRLPAQMALDNVQYGLKQNAPESTKLLVIPSLPNRNGLFMGLTGPNYGRIWDADVADTLLANNDGTWQVPSASYSNANPLRATTLYAGESNIFVFLVDPNHPVEVKGETLFRGFYAWNSEVGDSVFGLCTFLYRVVCDNRIIWGTKEINEVTIRHTSGGPDRFAIEAAPALLAYAESSTRVLEDQITRAKMLSIAQASSTTPVADAAAEWLKKQGFTAKIAKAAVQCAIDEEGDPSTLWNIVQGLTAHARSIEHTDTRVKLESQAGALMALTVE